MLHTIVVHTFDYERAYILPLLGGGQIATTYVTNNCMCVLMYLLSTVN